MAIRSLTPQCSLTNQKRTRDSLSYEDNNSVKKMKTDPGLRVTAAHFDKRTSAQTYQASAEPEPELGLGLDLGDDSDERERKHTAAGWAFMQKFMLQSSWEDMVEYVETFEKSSTAGSPQDGPKASLDSIIVVFVL